MEDQFYIFDPGTNTSKAPIPTTFEHLLKYITKDENFLGLHSQDDITNINQQLDQTLNLMVSNIIQRVIAQVIGQTDRGFVTIKGTDAGALHVHVTGSEGTSHTELSAPMTALAAGTHDITVAAPSHSFHITSIMLTVDDECTIALRDETGLLSGVMNFGGADEPRGLTHNFGLIPLLCHAGEKFQVVIAGAGKVSGLVTGYDA